jgi:hypothetical protein
VLIKIEEMIMGCPKMASESISSAREKIIGFSNLIRNL